MAHYLITGGAGFIGSHLVDRLLADNHRVVVIDDFSTGKSENLPCSAGLDVIEADLLTLSRDRLKGSFDALVHLAALPSVNDSWERITQAHMRNLTTTVKLIELAKQIGIPRIVYASSAAVYGNPQTLPIVETDTTKPLSPYGLQKLTGEEYGRLLAGNDLSFVALRFFNVFGPRQVVSSPYSGVITKFAKAMRDNQPLTIFGDGSQTRDFVYVKDIAAGILKALQASFDSFAVFNLGSGSAVSIEQLATTMAPYFPGWNQSIKRAPQPPGDIQRSEADISAARKLLSYDPQFTLESGLADFQASEQVI